MSEPGVRPESRKIDLVVSLIERTGDGQRVLPAARGRIDAVDEELLTPDLDSWGRHLVRELERRAGGRGRRVVHVGDIYLDGVADPERFRRYLERSWLLPAFSQSRLFGIAARGGEGSEGALEVDVFVHAGQVEIALNVWDRGVQTASASIEMAQGLLPERYFGGGVVRLIEECKQHVQGERWTEAWRCYGDVLEREAGNDAATQGRGEVERAYGERIRESLTRRDFVGAKGVVEEFAGMAPDSVRLREWEREIAGAERRAEERRAAEAEARRKREAEEAERKRLAREEAEREGYPSNMVGCRKVVTIHDGTSRAKRLVRSFEDRFKGRGGKVVAATEVTPQQLDMRPVIISVCQKTPTPARNLRRTATLSARFRPRHRPHRHH